MGKNRQHYLYLLTVLATCVLFVCDAGAEFYKYVDRNGTIHFVDDPGKIPKEYREKKQVYRERYDDLSDEDRAAVLDKERREQEDARHKENERLARQKLMMERQEKERAREMYLKSLVMPVVITGNQVFVPVTLANGGNETEALLLLDTGATTTLITPAVAEKLHIEQAEDTRVGVVGGKVLRALTTKLSRVTVGPVSRADLDVVIVRQRGGAGMGDGLLGMNFLRGMKYTIDFKNQTLNWIP